MNEKYINIENLLNRCNEPRKYNFEAESDEPDISDMSGFEKFCIYQASKPAAKKSAYDSGRKFAEEVQSRYPTYKNFDCDGSGADIKQGKLCMLSRNIYRALWGWKDIEKTEFDNKEYKIKKNERYGKCGIELGYVGPDTMNSANTLLNIIVSDIVTKNSNMKKILRGRCSIRYTLELFKNKQISDLFIENINSVSNLEDYLDEYHKIGNFVLVPAYFNNYRAAKVKDFWIESLVCLKEKQKGDKWIYKNSNILWDADNFILYINYFFLWDYLDGNGNFIDYTSLRENDVSEYMKRIVNHIKKRSAFMALMLEVYHKLGEDEYEKLRREIFENRKEIYKNYDEVIKLLSEYLAKNPDELLKEKCVKYQVIINKIV